MASNAAPASELPIVVKITYQGVTKKFKIPLAELTPAILPSKLRGLLNVSEDRQISFERFSDSAGAYISLDPSNAPAYRTLFRAAKAKQKLRLRATSPADGPAVPSNLASLLSKPQSAREAVSAIRGLPSTLSLNPTFAASETTLNNPAGDARGLAAVNALTRPQATNANDEAVVPNPFSGHDHFFAELSKAQQSASRSETTLLSIPGCHWSVYCNSCDQALPNEHWHCDTCDQGDYDLCSACHDDGKHCRSSNHYMVKRWIENGKVTTSRTERITPKSKAPVTLEALFNKAQPTVKREPTVARMPGAFAEEKKPEPEPEPELVAVPTRTCNCCVKVFPEQQFVTCLTCEDYDLCLDCHCNNRHGHHPGHAFKPAVEGTTVRPLADFLLAAGRNVHHAAVCDGCDRHIYGVRHKCLNCPDWDFCSDCVKSAPKTHPGHRFAPVYEPLADSVTNRTRHIGVFCDGPLCKDTPAGHLNIVGVRYKCAICHDTDFCANCEAAPQNKHNRTHPLIKFKTHVRNVSVSTLGEDGQGQAMPLLGDRRPRPATCAVSPIQPIVNVKPTSVAVPKPVEKIEIKDLLAEPITEKIKVRDLLSPAVPAQAPTKTAVNASTIELNAHFVHDVITDGTKMSPNEPFVQTWTLRNPGPHAWPAGCSVRYVGGDNMLCVNDTTAPGIVDAVSSNTINRPVQVGEHIGFHVVMRAPAREGTSISYWRLKTQDGMPFGHRLWCHINVTNTALETLPPSALKATDLAAAASQIPPPDPELVRMFREMSEKRKAMSEAIKETELRVKKLQEAQKMSQAKSEEHERLKRIQMLRALHAARLAAVSAEKKDLAASMKPVTRPKIEEVSEIPVIPQIPIPAVVRAPPAPTVEDVPEKEEDRTSFTAPQVKTEPVEAKNSMVFPKLEKESPASSLHEAGAASVHTTTTAAETIKTETASEAPLSPARTDTTGFFEEDAQTIRSFDEDDSDDDGFLTDEEYDILDASDEEEHL